MITKEETKVLKAIAILAVIITHANGFSHSFTQIPILKNGTITSIFSQGGMCTFLILSGYGLYESYIRNGLTDFWNKKYEKVFFPAIMVQMLWSLIQLLKQKLIVGNVSIDSAFFGDLICVNPENNIDVSIWYLSYLLYCYIAFFSVFKCAQTLRSKMITITVIWLATMPIVPKVWEDGFYCVSSFLIGVLLAYGTRKYKITRIPCPIRIAIIILSIAANILYYHHFRSHIIIDNVASNLLAIAYISIIEFWDCSKNKILLFLGEISFAIYLLQGKIIFGFFEYDDYDPNVRLGCFIILLGINIICASMLNRLITKQHHK